MAKKVCNKCGSQMEDINFYTTNNKELYPDGRINTCKKCWTMHVDNWDPDTFVPLLEEADVPYLEEIWKTILNRAVSKGQKITGMTVIGKYLSQMKLAAHKHKRFADTARLRAEMLTKLRESLEPLQLTSEEQDARIAEMLNFGDRPDDYMTDAERQELKRREKELNPPKVGRPRKNPVPESPPQQYDILTSIAAPGDQSTSPDTESSNDGQSAGIDLNNLSHVGEVPEMLDEEDVRILNELTDEDKRYLRLKWGKYRPTQLIQLEQLEREMLESYDIQTAGHKDTLKLCCKASLKTNELMDLGDMDGASKAARMYDSLMKSGKFTAAQNKNDNGEAVDSVAEFALLCEKEYGFLPSYYQGVPQDCVDETLEDLRRYVYNLVVKEQGLGDLIEQALKEMKREAERELSKDDDMSYDFDESEVLKDVDFEEFNDFIEEDSIGDDKK